MKKSEATQETGSLLSEMIKLQEQLGRVIQRLQNVRLKPRVLKKCARAVSRATESILIFTTIIGKEETKTKDSKLIDIQGSHQSTCESVEEKRESEPGLKAEHDGQNPNAAKTNRSRHVKEEDSSISEKEKIEDNSADDIIMENTADEDPEELSENVENDTVAEPEGQISLKERHKCSECNKSFTSKYYLKYHVKTHTEVTKTKCDVCNKVYSSYELMSKHKERIHSKKRRLECKHCFKHFPDASQLKVHMRDHTGEKPYQCPHCDAKFRVKSCMKDHVNIHTGAKPYLCNVCGKGFAGRGGLYLHTKIHTKDYPHQCETCHKRFPTKQRLNDHLKSHSEERPYRCHVEDCNTVFKSVVTLKKHIKGTHGPKQYFCDICAKQFTRAASLKLHTQLHQGTYKYACQQCNKTFRDSSRLRQHEQVHKNIRPFVCTECKKGFHNKRTLQDHFRIHTGDKPFTCHICERKFTQSATLNKHIRSHQKGLREIATDKIPKQKASKSISEGDLEKVTNSISQLGQNILQSTALSGLPMPETQQHKQQTILVTTQQQGKQLLPQQPATAQQQLSTTQEPVKIVPRITELTEQRQHMSQQQVATTQATMQQQQQMHITGPQVKSEDRKLLLPGYAQTPDLSPGSLDGQVQQSHKASNIIDSSTSALAILADSSLQHHHSDSRLSHASSSATAIPTTNTTTAPIISTVNVSNVTDASGAKHVQSSFLFTSSLASFSGNPTAQYTVPPIANIMSSLKSAGGVGGLSQTAASLTSLNSPAACTAGTSTSFRYASSENTLPVTAISEASTNAVPPQVLGIQQIAAQIIQEAKKQERKVTESSTTTKPSDTSSAGSTS